MSARRGEDGTRPVHVAVVGGGFTGLAAAYELTRQGCRVTVLERDAELGGLAGSFAVGETTVEKFYHHWFRSDRHVLQLVEELGLGHRLVDRETRTGLYYNRRISRLSTPLDVLRFPGLRPLDRLRLGRMVLRARKVADWRALEGLTAAEWLRQLAGPEVYRVLWEPLLRGKFGPYADEISAVWIWSKLILRGGSRNRRGAEVLTYLRGGFSQLAQRIEERIVAAGGEIRTRCPADRVFLEDDRVAGVLADGERIHADAVLLTTALPLAAELMRGIAEPHYIDELLEIDYLANVCLVLELDRSLSTTYWLNVADPGFPYVGIIEHTNFEPADAYGQRHIVYLSRYLPVSDPLYSMSSAEILEFSLPHLARMFPAFRRDWILNHRAWKARYAQPVVVPHYSALIPDHESPLPGLYLASMAQIYPEDRGTNYAVRDGRCVARRLLQRLAAGRTADSETYTIQGRGLAIRAPGR